MPSNRDSRTRLAAARLYLIFTPNAPEDRHCLAALAAAAPWIDIVQVRPKAREAELEPLARADELVRSSAREVFEWTERVLAVVAPLGERAPLVIVNDRVDVARALLDRGVAGVHVGQDDTPASIARKLLGEQALVGISTHSLAQVVAAQESPIDYLGFGPVWATATKGYARGLGPTTAWIACEGSDAPVFPIGGVSLENAVELAEVGRAAVSSAILGAADPAAAAQRLRAALEGD